MPAFNKPLFHVRVPITQTALCFFFLRPPVVRLEVAANAVDGPKTGKNEEPCRESHQAVDADGFAAQTAKKGRETRHQSTHQV